MKALVLIFIILIFTASVFGVNADSHAIKYQINKPYCILNFMETLRTKGYFGPTVYDFYKNSKFYEDEKLNDLIKLYKKVGMNYSYEFKGYPKYRYLAKGRSTRDLFYMLSAKTESLAGFKQMTAGIIPYEQHQKLFEIFEAVEPIYDELIWNPYYEVAQKKLAALEDYSQQIRLNEKLPLILNFFQSSWPEDIPLIVSFSIAPGEKVKRIPPPQSNVIFCGLLTESEDYASYVGKITHEFAHRAFAEKSLEAHQQIDKWFAESKSPHRFMVNFMFNEVLGGVVGHKINEELIGPHEFSYGQSFMRNFDEAIYPLFESWFENGKSLDSTFVQKSLEIYGKTFPNAHQEYEYLLQTYYLLTDVEDYPVHKLPQLIIKNVASPLMYEFGNPVMNDENMKNFMEYDFTKLIVITQKNEETFEYLKARVVELKQFNNLDFKSDFVLSLHDATGRAYIIMNLTSIENFEAALKMLKERKSFDSEGAVFII